MIDVTLYVVPADCLLRELDDYEEYEVGSCVSTEGKMQVNRVKNGFSIIFTDIKFMAIKPMFLVHNIVESFRKKFPDTLINISTEYLYTTKDEDLFNINVVKRISVMNQMFDQYIRNSPYTKRGYIRYEPYNVSKDIEDYHDHRRAPRSRNTQEDRVQTEIEKILGLVDDDDDFDDERPKKKKKRKSSKNRKMDYDISRVLKNAKNPKRMYKRHGVLVAKNKDVLQKDRKIIKEFLKDFIPGDNEWKKDLRRELADRWISVFAVTVKQLKHLEKKHKKMIEERKHPRVNPGVVLDFARGMVSQSIDTWYNPNK